VAIVCVCRLYINTRHFTTLHYTTPHYTTLHYTSPHYTTLHFTTLHYTTPHFQEHGAPASPEQSQPVAIAQSKSVARSHAGPQCEHSGGGCVCVCVYVCVCVLCMLAHMQSQIAHILEEGVYVCACVCVRMHMCVHLNM
jgi:hypothetical protein